MKVFLLVRLKVRIWEKKTTKVKWSSHYPLSRIAAANYITAY